MDEHSLSIQEGKTTEQISRIISPVTWKYLQKGYFVTRWFPFHPYQWDEGTKGPKVVTGLYRLFLWRFYLLSAIAVYGVLLYRCLQVTVLDPGRRLEQTYVLFLALFYFTFIVLQIYAAFKCKEIVNLLHGLFLLTAKCEGNMFEID